MWADSEDGDSDSLLQLIIYNAILMLKLLKTETIVGSPEDIGENIVAQDVKGIEIESSQLKQFQKLDPDLNTGLLPRCIKLK